MYINYHCHTHYSNIRTPDSVVQYEDYIERIKELGYGVLMSTEHGWQGHYLEAYEKAKEAGIKFVYGTEAYWVIDNKEKDKTNNHIILLAKNMNGIKVINLALSKANTEGYYHKPRLSIEDILNLPENDVFITTACIAFNGYGKDISEDIILKLHNKFKDNFMLEVQYHNTEEQKEWNEFLLSLSMKYGIDIIAGMDSHFIYPEQAKERDAFLKAKNIIYENEEGWYLDFPSYEEAIKRFKEQGVLSDEQIKRALNNTNLINDFEDVEFSKDIKIPILLKNKTYEERVEHFKNILRKEWKEESKKIPKDKHKIYIEEIKKEIDIVVKTKMVDYFILNYYVIKKAKEKGGQLTLTGRGSAPSFYITKLLGFTTIDRINSPIQLFPERFMSISRILETKSLPDIDFNTSNPEIFIEAQRGLLGENSSFYMIAFGKLKEKSAFKTYARANELDFDLANKITKRISDYEKDQKHSEEELNIFDYIDKEYKEIYEKSIKYQGVIESASRHPCGVLSYDGNVLEDIGVMRLRNDIVTVIDGKYLDKYKYVKNDFLKVNVVDIIYKVFEKIGIKPIPAEELLEKTRDDEKVWKIYSDGITLGINQVEQEATRKKCMIYKPKNISELSAFVASIRPGFASIIDKFLKREKFSYNIPEFDKLIQTKQMQDSWLLYQEQIMKTLEYAGFKSDETYGIIKSIAKKVQGVVEQVEDKFIKGFISKGNTEEDARKVWQVILDNTNYSFNSSHSLSVAIDSLYGAYLKTYYPYEFYQVMLELYTENKDLDKVSAIKKEMEYFGIKIGELKFGLDNTGFIIDKENKIINQSLKTVKFINSQNAEDMKKLGENKNLTFLELLEKIKETSLNSRQLDVLIKIGYFKDFAGINKLLKFVEFYNTLQKKTFKNDNINDELKQYLRFGETFEEIEVEKNIPKDKITEDMEIIKENTKTYKVRYKEKKYKFAFCEFKNGTYINIDKENLLKFIWDNLPDEDVNDIDKVKYDIMYLGYPRNLPSNISAGTIKTVSMKNRSVEIKSFRGNTAWFRVPKDVPLPSKNDNIIILKITRKKTYNKKFEYFLKSYLTIE